VRVTGLTGEYSSQGSIGVRAGKLVDLTTGTQPWSKAGIMIKASTTQGSAYAAMLVTGSNGTRMQWNYTGDAAGLPGDVTASSPRWLRLVRSGSTVTGYDSLNGSSWTVVGSYAVRGLAASGTVQAGLFATSPTYQVITESFGSSSGRGGPSLTTGTFDNVSVAGSSGSWTGTSIGSSTGPVLPGFFQPTGPASIFNGSYKVLGPAAFTVSGSGDIAPDVLDAPDGNGMSPGSTLVFIFASMIVVIIVAALFITAEYRRGMIRVTFAAAPSRTRVLAAKSVVIGAITFVAGLVTAGILLPVGISRLRSQGNWIPPISALTEARVIVGTALLLALFAVLALAIATMARRSVLAIAGVIVVIFVPFLLSQQPGLLSVDAQRWLLRVMPIAGYAVQQAYPAYHQVLAPYWPADGYYPLSPWAGLAVLAAWTAVALAGAAWLLRRRDA
jgi:ABC-type transport system involved in multi-copper enzyme maturation permease subunit